MIRNCCVAVLLVALAAPLASAQVTITGGVSWSGGYDIGSSNAQLRSNATGASTPPFTLFNVDSRISPSPGGEIRVGVAVTRGLTVEAGATFARRRLGFSISGDPEAGAQEFEGESLQHYVFDAGVLWELPVIRRARVRTFAAAGGGYLRQLHQDRTLVEGGQTYYLGGGARYWLRGLPESPRSLGVRGDLRVNVRRGAIGFDDRPRSYPTLSISMFFAL